MNNIIFLNRLFPWKLGTNRKNLLIDQECVSYITIPKDSNKIAQIISSIYCKKYNKTEKEMIIIDSTACVGGDTITFANIFGIVIPIEIDQKRYHNLIHNLQTYNICNVYPINGDSTLIINNIQLDIDVIYIDPPWGGNCYKMKQNIELQLGGINLDVIIMQFLNKAKLIILKLPKNYNFNSLEKKLNNCNMIVHNMQPKISIVSIEKI